MQRWPSSQQNLLPRAGGGQSGLGMPQLPYPGETPVPSPRLRCPLVPPCVIGESLQDNPTRPDLAKAQDSNPALGPPLKPAVQHPESLAPFLPRGGVPCCLPITSRKQHNETQARAGRVNPPAFKHRWSPGGFPSLKVQLLFSFPQVQIH